MSSSVVLSKNQYESIFARLTRLEGMVSFLADKLEETLKAEPPYGSKAWWEWSDKKSMEDYKNGKYITLTNKKDIDKYFSQI